MVVANGWPLLKRIEDNCDYDAIARLRMALKSRQNAAVGSGSDINNIPWRVSEHKFIISAFTAMTRFILPNESKECLEVSEEGDTEAVSNDSALTMHYLIECFLSNT
eukprot:g6541.t1